MAPPPLPLENLSTESQAIRELARIRSQLNSENQYQLDIQMERSEQSIDQYSRTMTTTLVKDAQRHLELQNLPINMPDPVPRCQFIKPSHGCTNMRGLTANETAEKQANQQRHQRQMSARDQER